MRVALADHIKIVGGGTPSKSKPEYWDGDIPWVSVKDLKSELILQTQDHISESGVENSATRVLPKNTLVVATRMAVGKTAILGQASAINQDIKGIIPEATLDNSYLKYALDASRGELERLSTGATVKGIKIEHLMQLQIPLPSLPEQRRIAARLDAADRLRQLDKALIEKYDELKRSLFLEMFGENLLEKDNEPLAESINVVGGYAFKSADFVDSGIPLIKIGTVNKGYFDVSKFSFLPSNYLEDYEKWVIKDGDLLVSLTGTIGKEDYGNIERASNAYPAYLLNQRVAKIEITSSNLNTTYLEYAFRSPELKRSLTSLSRGVRQANISNTDILNLPLYIPESQDQLDFEKSINSLSLQQSLARRSLACSEDLFQGLLGEVFG